MKHIFIKVSLIVLCIIGIASMAESKVHAYNQKESKFFSLTEDKEELYEDFLTVLLAPQLDKAIEGYYGKTKKYSESKIIDIKRAEKESGYFTVTFQVKTFDDNNLIGLENISISNDGGEIEVTNFIHEDVPVKTSR